MQIYHPGVDKFVISRLRTKAPDIKTTTVVDRSRALCSKLMMLWFCTFHRTISSLQLYVDFECFKLALWPTLRQEFMNFWSFLTRPGEKHDKNISNCIALRLPSWSKLTILAIFQPFSRQDSRFFFVQLKRKYLLSLSHNWCSSCKRWELQAV